MRWLTAALSAAVLWAGPALAVPMDFMAVPRCVVSFDQSVVCEVTADGLDYGVGDTPFPAGDGKGKLLSGLSLRGEPTRFRGNGDHDGFMGVIHTEGLVVGEDKVKVDRLLPDPAETGDMDAALGSMDDDYGIMGDDDVVKSYEGLAGPDDLFALLPEKVVSVGDGGNTVVLGDLLLSLGAASVTLTKTMDGGYALFLLEMEADGIRFEIYAMNDRATANVLSRAGLECGGSVRLVAPDGLPAGTPFDGRCGRTG